MAHLLALLAVAALAAPSGDVRKAARLEAWGDLPEARAEVLAALAKDPKDRAALFVAACLDLEAGDLKAAEKRTQELAQAAVPQAKVLSSLIERRRRRPRESLRDAIAPAWKAAGRPDLAASPLKGIDEGIWADGLSAPIDEKVWASMTPGERVLFAPPGAKELDQEALAASLHPERNPVTANQRLIGLLRRGHEPYGDERTAALARVATALGAVDRDNGYWDHLAWLATSSQTAPLTPADLDRLERQARRARFEYPQARLLGELRSLAKRFDPEHAACRAAEAEIRMGVALFAMRARAQATSWDGADGAALKRRTAKVMTAIGGRLAQSRSYLDRSVGVGLVANGALLSDDPGRIEAASRRAGEAHDRYKRAADNEKKAGSWPFSAVCRDWSPDDVTYFERYLD